jgi:DNA polymerase
LFYKIKLNNYDVMVTNDRGLKSLEGFMGDSIKESSVPFDLDRPLTESELAETVEYCRYDVERTMSVFLQRIDDFEAHMGLVKLACENRPLDLSLISKTKPQLSAIILGAIRQDYDDEFDIDFPPTMKIEKYKSVVAWYADYNNRTYNSKLEIEIAGVPHVFGWGGLHGALEKYSGEGDFLNIDVTSMYPSLMIEYELGSRSIQDPSKYEQIYNQRLQYKRDKNPLQLPLKLVLNSTYGVMKDQNNALYDPLQANRVCIYGQLLLLDLIEHLEPHCKIIQSNTDGVLVKLEKSADFDLIDDICYEWEQRTRLNLEFEDFVKVYQKDVNNYIMVDNKGSYKSKGAYVKKLGKLDYDLPIINKALIENMVKGIPIEDTIQACDELKEFQLVSKIGGKYTHLMWGNERLKERCVRVFASKNSGDSGLKKVHLKTGKPAKVANSPLHCFIYNGNMDGVKCPEHLDKQWYIDLANKRLRDFLG